MKILTLGTSTMFDLYPFRRVREILNDQGHDLVLFKQDKCLERDGLLFGVQDGQTQLTVVSDGMEYPAGAFGAVWNAHPKLPTELLDFSPAEYRPFIERQFTALRRALWSVLCDRTWVSNPWNCYRAENKIWQMDTAIRVGLLVPDTIITSDPQRAIEFCKSHKNGVVVKSLATSPMVGKVIFTSRVTEEYLAQIESLRLAPAIFQELVPKDYELRITVVGGEIFTARIDSQGDLATSLDWRVQPDSDRKVGIELTKLPGEIEKGIRRLMSALGLNYGAIDMIVNKGRYIFLEINPNGQWQFIQQRTGADIAMEIAKALTIRES